MSISTGTKNTPNTDATQKADPPPPPPPPPPPSPPSKSDPLMNEAQSKINSVQATYDAAVENGLVGNADEKQRDHDRGEVDKCHGLLVAARKSYSGQNYPDALDKAEQADTALSEIIQSRGFGWRFLNLYAGPWFIILAVWLGVLVWAGYSVYLVNLHSYVLNIKILSFNIPKMLRLVILTAIAGGLGAVLRQTYYVSWDVKQRQFKRSESIDIVMSPFIGFLFGFLAYLVIAAGLLVATQKATGSSAILNLAVGFLLGFNWKAAHDYMKSVTTSLLGGSASTGTPAGASTQKPGQGSTSS